MVWQKPIQKICFYSLMGAIVSAIVLTIGYYTPRKWSSSEKTDCNWQVCIENNGAHTNIIVPVDNYLFAWSDRIDIKQIDRSLSAKYLYLSFGWGDRDFYLNTPTWDKLDWGLAFKALFLPTPSVMEVKGLNSLPNNEKTKCIPINRTDYINLMDYIDLSFQTDRQGKKIRLANGHFDRGGFYAAEGTYSISNTCNDWTAIGLRKANLNTPLWSGLSTSIMRHLKSNCNTD